ncbi:diguanylate cyclase domain-containing protein [Pseudomonas sp. PB3P13]
MSSASPESPGSASLPTLRTVLRRGHLKVALVAVSLAGLSLTLLALFALRAYADHNLQLIARSISYTVEAAVVFDDKAAATEVLSLIAASEEVAEVQLLKPSGDAMASWARPEVEQRSKAEALLADLLMVEPVSLPILHHDRTIGTVMVAGDGTNLLHFLVSVFCGIIGCLALSIVVAQYLSRRLLRSIVRPLRKLAEAAHVARVNRTFDQRVPKADIAELNHLNSDFNCMLGELENWQAHLENQNRALTHEASHDSLTGLPNRAFFNGRLSRALIDARTSNDKFAVLFLDSDRFKTINDTHGHAAGDAVLTSVAARVSSQVRNTDLVARLGGDEFAVLLSPIRHIDDVVKIADAIITSMKAPINIPDNESVTTSLSIGVAVFPLHGKTPDQLLDAADAAMYEAKRSRLGGLHIALSDQTL